MSGFTLAEGFPCLRCGGPIPTERLRNARRGLYCSDDCMRARRSFGALQPRPAELELLDRGVGCSLCIDAADGWLTGAGSWDGPYCLAHFELVLDRIEALAIAPRLADTLPPLVRAEGHWQPAA